MANYPIGFKLFQVYKEGFNERWSNNYLLPGVSFDTLDSITDAIIDFETNIHSNGVRLTYGRLSTTNRNDRAFRIIPIQTQGEFNQTTDLLPFACTANVIFKTQDSYPGRKYFHGCLQESDQAAGVLNGGALNRLTGFLQPFLAAVGNSLLVGSNALSVSGFAIEGNVGNHQASRRRRYPR